jgi:hypothetical protein
MKNHHSVSVAVILAIAFFVSGCSQSASKVEVLQSRLDSLEVMLDNDYRPGLGEFMTSIQVHHAKLWFAGQNQNWKLADFEIKEIMEAVEDIQKFNNDREEIKMITILQPPLDSMKTAIAQKEPTLFKNGFVLLTNACNTCHRANNFEFNVIKIPETSAFGNQEFKVK